MTRKRKFLSILLTIGFATTGILHFVRPSGFVKIVPPYLPAPEALVAISGLFEILGAIGIQIPILRKVSALGLIALLVAVFPANIFMAFEPEKVHGWDIPQFYLYLRLLFQPLFIYWVWYVGFRDERGVRTRMSS